MPTEEQYYADETQHGNYQYVTATEILAAMEMEALDDDSYLKNTPRYKMFYHLRQGIKEITRQASNEPLAIEFIVPSTLVWTMPPNYVDYYRVSVVVTDNATSSKRLMPLDINQNINTATGYVQDNANALTFDGSGNVITDDISNAYAIPYKTYQFLGDFNKDGVGYTYGYTNNYSRIDTAKLSEYGEFKPDPKRGKLLFSSQLSGQTVVLEYISDGLQNDLTSDEITVHKEIEQCLKDWIYAESIRMKRNVPQSERESARRRYKTTLHSAKIDRMDFNLVELNRAMRTKTMQP